MPMLLDHMKRSERIFGRSYEEFHKFMDLGTVLPFPLWIFHRFLPPHGPISAFIYALLTEDPMISLVWAVHILQDFSPWGIGDGIRFITDTSGGGASYRWQKYLGG